MPRVEYGADIPDPTQKFDVDDCLLLSESPKRIFLQFFSIIGQLDVKMKRKLSEEGEDVSERPTIKKQIVTDDWAKGHFRDGLFDSEELAAQTERYSKSKPYKHGVISDLITPDLLCSVRKEIQNSLSFTLKETDIYRIYQSGDLANLDGLDGASLSRLPSLLKLRDALYSSAFRAYLSAVTASGPLSGKKTDMAINVYTPGCHLLCHDDVIGSRRVSYILYLTDPDQVWKSEWGGALRLYPTIFIKDEDGLESKTPSPDHSMSIPPAFSQLSFFAVQPGESFHDVEEVYGDGEVDEKRVRMAISGWYHIPQEGEEGYVEGLEEQLAEKSSLVQLQGKADRYDLPETRVSRYDQEAESAGDEMLTEADINLLLQYMAPTYLTPDTLEELQEMFSEESCLRLETFLSKDFTDKLRTYIEQEETNPLPKSTPELEKTTKWRVARPPHKHRFLYQQLGSNCTENPTPIHQLLNDLLPSNPFRKWLTLATGLKPESHNLLARRFRRGHDYTLATGYEEEQTRLELNLSITPTSGWGDDDDDGADGDADDDDDDDDDENNPASEKSKVEASATQTVDKTNPAATSSGGKHPVGGYEIYMAADEDDTEGKKSKSDPAVYKAAGEGGDEDDGVLFSLPAGWNRLSIVLRDKGVLRFVKYVSREAKGDRWDLIGEFDVDEDDDDGEDDEKVEEQEEEEEEQEEERQQLRGE
ncbi:MAG: hypothetical protein M1816_001141 [Peltula sp. TS41687]|nr:MAG: hypothetical protein M1816_001141 [Peltula sp. TS41687]